MRKPEVYEITSKGVTQHKSHTRAAENQAKMISPCFRAFQQDWARGEATGWSRDGRRIAWLFYVHTTACMGSNDYGPVPPEKQWKPFWMISDVESGQIVPGSIHIVQGDEPTDYPTDPMYDEFRPGR